MDKKKPLRNILGDQSKKFVETNEFFFLKEFKYRNILFL